MNAVDLRAELGARPDPDFELTPPPGWTRRGVDQASQEAMVTQLRERLMREHQPQLLPELKSMLDAAFEGMRRDGAFAFYSASEAGPDTLWIPASIVASIRRAEPGQNLDGLVRGLVRDRGATPLRHDKSVVRFERERVTRLAGAAAVNQSVVYLIPVPGANRSRALQLTAGFGRPVDTPPDHPTIVATKVLLDSCVSTLRWIPRGTS